MTPALRPAAPVLALAALAALAVGPASAQFPPGPGAAPAMAPVYRLYNRQADDHVYTVDPNEVNTLANTGLAYEGTPFAVGTAQGPGLVPLYRIYQATGTHRLSTNLNNVPAAGPVRNEGILGYISAQPRRGLAPLTEWYNPASDGYFYTIDPRGEFAPNSGYRQTGVVLGYVVPAG